MAIVASRPSSVRTSHDGRDWQLALKSAVRDPHTLCRLLNLPPQLAERAEQAAQQFPVFAPLSYIGRMKPADPHDPLLRQVLPLDAEMDQIAGFVSDPVGDAAAVKQPGLLQKYAGRALLVTTGACAVHCRYCFRRHFPYHEGPKTPSQWQLPLDQIAADPSLEEVLLSGGDPLMLPDTQLSELTSRIAQIPHVSRLRVHSRLPIMIPQRVNRELVSWLRGTRLTPLMVVHANHPSELNEEVGQALGRLVDAGIPVLNQAVLLKGVNDRIEDLAALCRRLVDLRVMPYYLHQLDRVQGAAHFEVPVEQGRLLMRQLRDRLPGYAVPRYVAEVAGTGAKQPIE